MSNWKQTSIGEFVDFNPSESIKKGSVARKIGMDKLGTFQRKINGSENLEYSAGPKFRNGDTVVAKITPCLENGKTAYVDILEDEEVAYGSSEFIVLRENENSDSKFIYYLARSPLFRERAISCMEGTSGRKRVNEGALKRQELLVPNLPIQQKIAAVLSALDDKIELNNKINAELEAMAKTLYDYWFVQFDFPNAEGKPYKSSGGKMVYNETLKREIPEGWEVKRLKEIAKTGSGGTPKSTLKEYYDNGNIPWINSGELNSPFIVSTDNFISELGMKNSSAKLFPANTILMAMYGATAGKTSIISFEASTNQAICAVMPNDNNKFYYTKFVLDDLYQYLINLSTGSARDNLSQDKIKELSVVIPTNNILNRFSEIIELNFRKIESNLKQNQELAQLRDWLLPMLMNGQVRVSEVGIGDIINEYANSEVSHEKLVAETFGEYLPKKQHNINDINKELAALIYLMNYGLGANYGNVAVQKAVYNSSVITPNLYSKKHDFINYNFGTFSKGLADDLSYNPYLKTKKINGFEVYEIEPSKKNEILNVLSSAENKDFVSSINKLIDLYRLPFINKETNKMELLNSVLKIHSDLKTTDIKLVYQAMKDWKIKQTGFKTKAEKFSIQATQEMIELLIRNNVM